MIVADHIAERLVRQRVRHVFGVGGANIEDLFAAVQRRRPELRAVLHKHEHAAATAADAYARLGGGIGVVLATSGGGTLNLVHALAEAQASRSPVLAIVGEPPSDVQGEGAFQDTSGRNGAVDAAAVLARVCGFCARAERAEDVPELLERALSGLTGPRPEPAALLLAKDRQRAEIEPPPASALKTLPAPALLDSKRLERAAAVLEQSPVLILAGSEVARDGARDDLVALARLLDAQVAVAPDARDAFDNHDPRFLGVSGAMGHAAVAHALERAAAWAAIGTRVPLLARMGLERLLFERPMVSCGHEPPFAVAGDGVHLGGDLRFVLPALIRKLAEADRPHRPVQPTLFAPKRPIDERFDSPAILRELERAIPGDCVVLVDAGNTGAQAVHGLSCPPSGRWLLAMGMAGMGYCFGAAVGAALSTGKRCVVLAGDGAFYMHGLDVHTAIEHQLPITYLIFNNRAHGMCLVRERLLLGSESGYNSFGPAHVGRGLAAMFPGFAATDCSSLPELSLALERAFETPGPSLIGLELPDVEVPPFVAFRGGHP